MGRFDCTCIICVFQSDLQQALENEEKLKMAQTAEMQEVENYVEHIRHLSDEREALIQELETENDNLKQEIEHLKQDQNGLYSLPFVVVYNMLFFSLGDDFVEEYRKKSCIIHRN